MQRRHFITGLIAASMLLAASPSPATDTAVVLMYHRFGDSEYPSTNIRVAQFEAQLEHLRAAGYTVVPLADVIAAVEEGRSLPARAVAITIDDAYASIYRIAYPRLKRYGYPFTVFVATDPVDEGLHDYLSWEQMREMAPAGAGFANHGASHRSFLRPSPDTGEERRRARIRADVERGRRRLAAELEPLTGVFAYPYGEYDRVAAEVLSELGYVAFGQHSGAIGPHSDPRALPRFPMAEAFADLEQFRTKVASLPLPVIAVDPWDPVVQPGRPTVALTLEPGDARLDALACYVGGQGRVGLRWLEAGRRFSVGPAEALRSGRHRVNCTAPGPAGRFYWYSHPWFVLGDQ